MINETPAATVTNLFADLAANVAAQNADNLTSDQEDRLGENDSKLIRAICATPAATADELAKKIEFATVENPWNEEIRTSLRESIIADVWKLAA